MQMLKTKSFVSIVTVNDGEVDASLPAIDVETALRRHGIDTETVQLEEKGRSIGYRLLEFLDEAKPNLLVMGDYEHSKFRQTITGGVTSTVLKKAKVPIFISH